MKKIFGLKSLFMGLLLLGAFLVSSNRVEAQSQVGNFNWKAVDLAKSSLVDAMIPVKINLDQLPAGQAKDEAAARLFYYKAIHASLEAGNAVDFAVITSLDQVPVVSSPFSVAADQPPVVTPAFRQVLYNDAVVILTQ